MGWWRQLWWLLLWGWVFESCSMGNAIEMDMDMDICIGAFIVWQDVETRSRNEKWT